MTSVIIVDYKTASETLALATCLRRNRLVSEVIVVDNGNVFGGNGKDYGEVIILGYEGNTGFGAAVNRAAAVAQGRRLLVVNPDLRLADDALDALASAKWLGQANTVVAPTIHHLESGTVDRGGALPTVGSLLLQAVGRRRATGSYPRVEAVSGACFSIDRETLLELGGFDQDFFLYFEETDLWKRGQGRLEFVVLDYTAVHDGGVTPPQLEPVFLASLKRYADKHLDPVGSVLVRCAWSARALGQFAMGRISRRFAVELVAALWRHCPRGNQVRGELE